MCVAPIVIEICKIMVKKKNPAKKPKHLVAAHGAEQAHQSDEASQGDKTQASVDIEELVSLRTVREMLKVQESMLRALFDSVVKSLTARVEWRG